MMRMKLDKLKKWQRALLSAGVLAVWLLLWQLACGLVGQELLLPSPAASFLRLWQLMGQGVFWQSALASLLRIIAGSFFGILIGAFFGIATAFSPILQLFMKPLLTIIKSTPVASFIILALIWMRKDAVPIFACALMVTPILWTNTQEGILQIPLELKEVVKVFRFTRWQQIRRLYLPHVLPYFYAACSSSLGLSWKAGVAAEVLSIPLRAVGTQLYYAKIYLESPDLFAWTAVVILLSVALEKSVSILLSKLRNEGV